MEKLQFNKIHIFITCRLRVQVLQPAPRKSSKYKTRAISSVGRESEIQFILKYYIFIYEHFAHFSTQEP